MALMLTSADLQTIQVTMPSMPKGFVSAPSCSSHLDKGHRCGIESMSQRKDHIAMAKYNRHASSDHSLTPKIHTPLDVSTSWGHV